jgi:serine protease Do
MQPLIQEIQADLSQYESEVIGINEKTLVNAQNIGLAISSNSAKKVVPQLISNGIAQHPWLGVNGIDMTPGIANAMQLQDPRGFLVENVHLR